MKTTEQVANGGPVNGESTKEGRRETESCVRGLKPVPSERKGNGGRK